MGGRLPAEAAEEEMVPLPHRLPHRQAVHRDHQALPGHSVSEWAGVSLVEGISDRVCESLALLLLLGEHLVPALRR